MKLFELHDELKVSPRLVELLKTHCTKNFELIVKDQVTKLYRADNRPPLRIGTFKNTDVIGFNSAPGSKADNTGVFSNTALDKATWDSAAWKNIPNRKTSVFCSPDAEAYEMFGISYLVVPYDNVKSFAFTPKDFNSYKIGSETITPEMLDVSVKPFIDLVHLPSQAEVWFDGGFIAIGSDDFDIIGTQWFDQLIKDFNAG